MCCVTLGALRRVVSDGRSEAKPSRSQRLGQAGLTLGVFGLDLIPCGGKLAWVDRWKFEGRNGLETNMKHSAKQICSEDGGHYHGRAITSIANQRDAAYAKEALEKATPNYYKVIIKIGSTRTSEELFGYKAFISVFLQTLLEEDVASHTFGDIRRVVVAIISTYSSFLR
ncbi:hypothetical protein PIB30_080216 [Stylosanthes scabra]|uniref:Uncharacterized protein n=1 Tax=Stylosanthes scabra TaxID=79078 RepID=A0ABU6YNY4_9FABA|nr:hypothetical protein [Stylosanthes scabra]